MKKKDLYKNIVFGFGGQFIVIVLGIIIPRIMIESYGSDTNGLISTISQIFSYLALLEAGIGQSARMALYKPLSQRDEDGILFVYSVALSYYRKISFFYGIGVLSLSLICPFIIKTRVSFFTVFWVTLLEGMSGVVTFSYIQTPSVLFDSDGKGYINNAIGLGNRIIGYAVKILLAFWNVNIIYLQLAYFIINIVKIFIYKVFLNKYYPWITPQKNCNASILKDKNSYVLTEIAWTIFSSTDMIVLSIFVSTELSSVYSIYNMIYSNVYALLNAVTTSLLFVLGQSYQKDIEKYKNVHDSFTSIILGIITILMSVSYVLTVPFINLYTEGVADINYIYTSLPIMFCLVQMLSWSRYVNGNLTALAGYAKQTSYISLVEAAINVVMSIILVQRFGIVGVLFATVSAMPIKVIWCAYVADKKVLHRSAFKSLFIIGSNFLFFFSVVVISKFCELVILSYIEFVIWGIVLTVILGAANLGMNILINKQCWLIVKKFIWKE